MDEILIAEALKGQVRIHIADMTKTVTAAMEAHAMAPTSCAALGRLLTCAALLASDLKKDEEKITVTVNGHGPAGTLIAQAKGNGDVRGLIGDPGLYFFNPANGKLDVGKAVGTNGYLTVMRDMGLKDPFTGTVKLVNGEIGEDFAYYLALSEQVNSAVSVGVLTDPEKGVRAAGGMIISLLPNVPEETIAETERIVSGMDAISSYYDRGMTSEAILHTLFEDAEILDRREVRWHCDCSREHFMDALATISRSDLEEMIAEGKTEEVVCHFCNKKYYFNTEDLQEILRKQSAEDR